MLPVGRWRDSWRPRRQPSGPPATGQTGGRTTRRVASKGKAAPSSDAAELRQCCHRFQARAAYSDDTHEPAAAPGRAARWKSISASSMAGPLSREAAAS